jgi:LacI family transcriptional regulator
MKIQFALKSLLAANVSYKFSLGVTVMGATGCGAKPVTIKDIAREAGISYATVSRALSGSSSVNENTRRRVLEISERMGYTANYVARSMVKRETRLIGIILPCIDNPFMSELAHHMEQTARRNDYSIMLCNSSYDLEIEEHTFSLLLSRKVDGVILVPSSRESCGNIKKYLDRTPTVFVNENLMDAPESYVTVDNYKGTRMGAEYLIELGHRGIVYFGRIFSSATHSLRSQGYKDACREAGITPLFWDSPTDGTSIEMGYKMALELFDKGFDFSAIFASTDVFALGVLQAADELGLRVPEDISLLGFDNIKYSGLPKINLSTIEQPKQSMASIAVEMLIEKIHNEHEAYSHRILMPTLIKRSSCMPLAQNVSFETVNPCAAR